MSAFPERYIGLCAICILNLNSAVLFFVGTDNVGEAKDMEGEILDVDGYRVEWKPGVALPAGRSILSSIILQFGENADIRAYPNGDRLRPFAVTMFNGTLVCEMHNGELFLRRGY